MKARYPYPVKRKVTFDSSFWVHAVYLDLIEFLLQDYHLVCTPAVEREMGRGNPTGLKLMELMANGTIQRESARGETIRLYGDGERAAINLALESNLLLLIDDWKPYEAAREYGVEVVNSLIYVTRLYAQGRITAEMVLDALAKMTQRGTVKPAWILEALKMVALLRRNSA